MNSVKKQKTCMFVAGGGLVCMIIIYSVLNVLSSDQLLQMVPKTVQSDIMDIRLTERVQDTLSQFHLVAEPAIGRTSLEIPHADITHITSSAEDSGGKRKLNVLFIMSDDMRAQLGCYEGPMSEFLKPKMHTPNIDRLASRSLFLKNGFVQYALCGPSRTSIMTSRRPLVSGVYDNAKYFRKEYGNLTTLPQYFKERGYVSFGIGKVYHLGPASGHNDPPSWSEPFLRPDLTYKDEEFLEAANSSHYAAVPEEVLETKPLPDMVAARYVKSYLKHLAAKAKSGQQNFFIGLGFKRPHHAYVCPKKFVDLYLDKIDIAENLMSLEDVEGIERTNTAVAYVNGSLPYYLGCISYVDSLVGEVVQAVEDAGLSQSTIIVFVADHGYQFGEHGYVGKSLLYDTATRVPMMIHIPGLTDAGIATESVVEALDLFPTVVEAAGFDPVAPCSPNTGAVPLCTHGKSLLPLIQQPEMDIRGEAITQQTIKGGKQHRLSIRLKRYRYTHTLQLVDSSPGVHLEWVGDVGTPQLYDNLRDPHEVRNIAQDPRYSGVILELQQRLDDHVRTILPVVN